MTEDKNLNPSKPPTNALPIILSNGINFSAKIFYFTFLFFKPPSPPSEQA